MIVNGSVVEEEEIGIGDTDDKKKIASTIEIQKELGRQKGFEVEAVKDYGAGLVNVVGHTKIHPALRDITCGFIIAQPLAKTLTEALARGEIKKREDFEDEAS